jgi:hypothetical protein
MLPVWHGWDLYAINQSPELTTDIQMDDKNIAIVEWYHNAVEQYHVRRSGAKIAFAVFNGNGDCVHDGFNSYNEALYYIEDKKYASEPSLDGIEDAVNLMRYYKHRALLNGYASLAVLIVIGIGGAIWIRWFILPATIAITYILGSFSSYRTTKLIEKKTGLTITELAELMQKL